MFTTGAFALTFWGSTMKSTSVLSVLSLLAIVACSPKTPAGSQPATHMGQNSMGMAMHAPGDSDATRGYKTSMMAMMAQMPVFTGNADTDFMRQMRGHHQAAIAMAEVELASGVDAEAKQLAETIIRDQKAEIAQIDAWLAKQTQ